MKPGSVTGKWIAVIFVLVLWCSGGHTEAGSSQPKKMTDRAISDALMDELQRDQAVAAHWIDVSTDEGIVSLSGSVDNILSKERASKIAGTVKGVRAVVNTMKVTPSFIRSDIEIQNDITEALLMGPATDSYEIDVRVENNIVTLTGSVDSWQERILCGKVAKSVKGVVDVDNNVVVTIKRSRPDSEIQQDIQQAFRWDVLLDHALIEVAVENGRVRLSGTVGSLAEKTRAMDNAYVAGVESVDTQKLKVALWARDKTFKKDKYKNVSDEQIAKAIKDALLYDPRVLSSNVAPQVENGVVTLRGTVDNLKAKKAAAQSTRHTVGVVKVVNRLKVRPSKMSTDPIIEDRIRRSFIRDPFIEPDSITITVRNGAVDLFGSVETFFQKAKAEDLVSRVIGVITVNNQLAVTGRYYSYPYDPYVDDWYSRGVAYRHERPMFLKSDAEIKADIQREFFWSPYLDSNDINIKVSNGTVTLTGKVDTRKEYSAARDNAFEGGAVIVNNKIEVR